MVGLMRVRSIACFIFMALVVSCVFPVTAQGFDFGEPFIPDTLYETTDILKENFSSPISNPLSCGVRGYSGEFSYEQTDASSLILNWTHTPGTELDYTGMNPFEYEEFAFFQQSFFWDYDFLPTASNLSLLYNVTTTGSFHNETAQSMFEIRIWLVGPNTQWDLFANFRPNRDQIYDSYESQGSWATDDTFRDLTDGGAGSAAIVVGLVPTWRFLGGLNYRPWMQYNGSVKVEFYHAQFTLLHRTNSVMPETGSPLYQTQWKRGYSDSFQDSYTTPDGNSYLLSEEDHEDLHNEISLTSLNPKLEVNWVVSWNDTALYRWYDVAGTSREVYLLGRKLNHSTENYDLCLAILHSNGDIIQEIVLDPNENLIPIDLDVDQFGNAYIVYINHYLQDHNGLVKVDTHGNILWRVIYEGDGWEEFEEIKCGTGGEIYTRSSYHIVRWDNEGNQLWSVEGGFTNIHVLSDGAVIASEWIGYEKASISKITSEGQEEWNTPFTIEFDDGWYDFFGITGFAESQDDTIFVLVGLYGYHPGRLILEISAEGESIANYTIAISAEEYQAFDVPQYADVAFTEDNLLYLYGWAVDENWNYYIIISAYGLEPFLFSTSNVSLLGSVAAAGLIFSTIVILQLKSGKPLKYIRKE